VKTKAQQFLVQYLLYLPQRPTLVVKHVWMWVNDGELVKNYGDMKVSIVSPTIKLDILKNWRARILSYWGEMSPGDFVAMGEFVEDLFWGDLKDGAPLRYWKVGDKITDTDSKIEFSSSTKYTNVTIEELTEKVFGAKEEAVCRMVKGCPLIDFAGPGLNVFQVTIRDKHDLNFNGMKKLLLAAGLGLNGMAASYWKLSFLEWPIHC
jgi:hypothetical protein